MAQHRAEDTNTKNEVGVQDDIGQDIVDRQKEQAALELEQFESALQKELKGKERFRMMWEDIDKKVYEIMLANFGKNPDKCDMLYEKDPEYWALKKKQFELKYNEDKVLSESRLMKFDMDIEEIEAQIKDLKELLKELGE